MNLFEAWTSITFVGDSVHTIKDPNNENETIVEEIPRLLIKSWYPWNAMSGMAHYGSLIYQVFSHQTKMCLYGRESLSYFLCFSANTQEKQAIHLVFVRFCAFQYQVEKPPTFLPTHQ